MKIRVRKNECSIDAIERYLEKNGYTKRLFVIVAGSCEERRYDKNGSEYVVGGTETTGNWVEFDLIKIA